MPKVKDVNITITEKLVKDFKKYAKNFCVGMATHIRDELTSTTAYAIEEFYNDYQPIYYKRHYTNFRENSFRKYYYNKHNSVIGGGVELTPEEMENYYHDPTQEVFDLVYHGIHGVAGGHVYSYRMTNLPPVMKPSPIEIIYTRRQSIIDNIQSYVEYGYERTKQDAYNTFI